MGNQVDGTGKKEVEPAALEEATSPCTLPLPIPRALPPGLDTASAFLDPLEFVNVHLESWVSKGLFDVRPKLLDYFSDMHAYITIETALNDTVLYIHGWKAFRTFAMFVIVSLARHLSIKLNRARAWARGLQSPVWWTQRYFI
ncbi:uncharacterized protein LOC116076532 [Mastomys coucha]|uniref:uncharacterized protein LOC116076532 n=1 Tax=Mastomys coucha TaxID=35658 RepID=UPI0012615A1E|nr:uncharacterized protein LOC116076532 [Mastomys coucha]